MDLSHLTQLFLLLRDPDFQTATEAAEAIEHELGKGSARAVDSRRIEIRVPAQGPEVVSRPVGESGKPDGGDSPPSQGHR